MRPTIPMALSQLAVIGYRSLGLIAAAAKGTQVWVIAPADTLINTLADLEGRRLLRLTREQGATVPPGQSVLGRAASRSP